MHAEQVMLWAAGAQSCWGPLGKYAQHTSGGPPHTYRGGSRALYPLTPDGHRLRADSLGCQFLQHLQHALGKAVDKNVWPWRVLRPCVSYLLLSNK